MSLVLFLTSGQITVQEIRSLVAGSATMMPDTISKPPGPPPPPRKAARPCDNYVLTSAPTELPIRKSHSSEKAKDDSRPTSRYLDGYGDFCFDQVPIVIPDGFNKKKLKINDADALGCWDCFERYVPPSC